MNKLESLGALTRSIMRECAYVRKIAVVCEGDAHGLSTTVEVETENGPKVKLERTSDAPF